MILPEAALCGVRGSGFSDTEVCLEDTGGDRGAVDLISSFVVC